MEDAARVRPRGPDARALLAGLVLLAVAGTATAQGTADSSGAPADSVQWLMASAREAAGRDDHAAALRAAAAAIALDPAAEAELDLLVAHQLTWSDRPGEAVPWYRRRLAHEPGNAEARSGLARALSWTGETDDALTTYGALLADEPDNLDAALGVARMHAWKDEAGAASRGYTTALAIDPTSGEAMRGLADAENRRGRHRRAETLYLRRLEAAPDDEEARIGMARARYWMGEEEAALGTLDGIEAGDGAELRDAILAERRAEADLSYSYWKDRDDQTLETVALHASRGFGGGRRGLLEVARFRADEPATPGIEGLRGSAGGDWRPNRALALHGRASLLGVGRNLEHDEVVQVGAGETLQGRDIKATYFLWDTWATWTPRDRLRIDLSHARVPIETPRALARGIRSDALGLGVDATVADRLAVRANGGVARFTDGNRRTSGGGEVEAGPFPVAPRLEVWCAAGGSAFRFEDTPDHGYYAPERYDALYLNGRARLSLGARASLEGDLRLGSEREEDADRFGVATGGLELRAASRAGFGVSAFGRWSTSRLDTSAGYARHGWGVSLFRSP